ncbi:MAG: serine/threonine protein kinase [Candidatus Riflebacteria bacterium]|nr:serine/threonine protein kinase [Candidatus Riflebacteria bacterium]
MEERMLGPFRLLELLGQGGMGAVYLARQETLDRTVAVKLLLAGAAGDEILVRRFRREMQLAAGLRHPGLVQVLDGGSLEGTAFIAMELVRGRTLQNLLARTGALEWPLAMAIVARVLEALAYLHEHGIIHRDVKPSNIMLSEDGAVKLTDFGVAKWAGATLITAQGSLVGTVPYMAPELLQGHEGTAHSDLWATGCLAYQTLCGRLPWPGEGMTAVIRAILRDPIPDPTGPVPGLPRPVSQLVMRLLERDPLRRPASAGETVAACNALLDRLARTSADRLLQPGCFDRTGPARSRTGRRRVLSSVPPAPSPRQPATWWRPAGAALLAIALAGAGWLALRPPDRPVAALSPVSSTGTITPAPASVPGIDPRRSSSPGGEPQPPWLRWQPHLELLPRLRAGGVIARKAVETLTRTVDLDLGDTPAAWIHWFELGQWLESPAGRRGPPRGVDAASGPMDLGDEKMVLRRLRQAGAALSPPLVRAALQMTRDHPDDGRSWLVLGRVLELAGQAQASRLVYRTGLARLERIQLGSSPVVIWIGLVRALLLDPGRLEKTWWTFAGEACGEKRVWEALIDGLGAPHAPLTERLLRMAMRRPDCALTATLSLAHLQEQWLGDPEAARATYRLGLTGPGDLTDIRERLVVHLLNRGRLAEAADQARHLGDGHWLRAAIGRLTGPSRTVGLSPRAFEGAWARLKLTQIEMVCRLLAHDLAGAEAVAETFLSAEGPYREAGQTSAFKLLAEGSRKPWVLEICRQRLEAENRSGTDRRGIDWSTTCKEWVSDEAVTFTERTLAGFQGHGAASASLALGRAVSASRRGRWKESLAHLDEALRLGRGCEPPLALWCEVLARPLWRAAAGEALDREVKKKLEENPGPPGGSVEASYWRHVRRGELRQAAEVACRLQDRDPMELYWAMVQVEHGRIRRDREALALWSARLEALVRFHAKELWMIRWLAGRP